MFFSVLLVSVFALFLRLLPMRLAPRGGGVDQWFWRAYIDGVASEKRFPPQLLQFKLDAKQWYPPLFPWSLAKLPGALFKRYAGHMAVCLDILRLLLLMVAAYWLSSSWQVATAAGVVYALTPVLITYNMQLNPRGLGAFFLDAALLLMLGSFLYESFVWWPAAVFVGLVLLCHKMTSQLLVFIVLVGTVALVDGRFLILLLVGLVVALILSGGFYYYVLRAHWDIVRFWFLNWRWTGANPILESPLYGEDGFESPSKFYRSGWRSAFRRLTFVIGFNPWMPAVLVVGGILFWQDLLTERVQFFAFGWLAIVFLFALLTTVLPVLRCFGQGYLYGYNGSFPAALAMGLSWAAISQSILALLVCIATAIASLLALFAFFRQLSRSRTLKVDESLDLAIRRLRELPAGTVMCLPQHWHDVVAYRTGKTVAFGGHGYGFRLLQPIFPRFLVPVKQFIAEQNVAYLLLWPEYVSQKFLNDLPAAEIEHCGDYLIYCFEPCQELGNAS